MAAVCVKPFGVAKRRLAPLLDRAERSRLGKAVAASTVKTIAATGTIVAVVTADDGVAAWAAGLGADVLREPAHEPPGLNRAAAVAMRHAASRGMSWTIVHADLPLIEEADFEAVTHALPEGGIVLAPSYDGGTNVLAGDVYDFGFHYGPGSFHRHLANAARLPHRVIVRPNLLLDLDAPADLTEIRALARVRGIDLDARVVRPQ